jgi:predicted AlkP superfamily pyrophosphatase or phosphodiesterase
MFRFKPMLGFVLAAASLAVISTATSYGSTTRPSQTAAPRPAQHVLLISVDGLHQSDLRW